MKNRLAPLERNEKGEVLMTKKNLRLICRKDDLYEIPIHNEKLYLGFKGFSSIDNLDEYINLRALWLNNNGFIKIENLDNQVKLIALYLNNNLI